MIFDVDVLVVSSYSSMSRTRRSDLIAGSFEAAKDEEVLEALRFVYNDIAPFRPSSARAEVVETALASGTSDVRNDEFGRGQYKSPTTCPPLKGRQTGGPARGT